jgi:uncharacterized protein (DUF302 family)
MTDLTNGLATRRSRFSFDETLQRLRSAIESKGATVFAVIDHAGEAARVGLRMPPTQLVIFGSPKAGTPAMLAAPSLAIDLPLKILVSEDSGGAVWMSYNTGEYLAGRHGLPREQGAALTAAEAVTAGLAVS